MTAEPLCAGPLSTRESVHSALCILRRLAAFYDESSLPAEIDIKQLRAVEEALGCCLPFEAIACLANNDGELSEYGMNIARLVDNTHDAYARGCSKDTIALGRHPDDHAFFCIARNGARSRSLFITDVDNFDGGERGFDLPEWLEEHVERRREFVSDDYPEAAGWSPSEQDLASFSIEVIDN